MISLKDLVNVLVSHFLKFGSKVLDSVTSLVIIYIIYKISCKIFKSMFSKKVFNARLEKVMQIL